MLSNMVHFVIYNGIQLNLTKIEEFSSEEVYDPSDTDRLYNKITIRVAGVVNASINYGSLTNAALLTLLRRSLMEPRRPLQVFINGVATIDVSGPDANNGPIPKDVKVYDFIGQTIMAEFSIDYWEPVCTASNLIILSNRWKQKSSIDQNGYTTLESTGKLVIDSSKSASNADIYRNIPAPIYYAPQGFVRQSQIFDVSEDGTTLDWSIVDQEVYLPPPTYTDSDNVPQPITDWDGDWAESSSMEQGGGAVTQGTLTVTAEGAKNVNKNFLLLFCVRVFQSRWDRERDVIRHYEFREGLRKNTVALTVTLLTFNTKNYENIKLQTTTRIGNTLDIYESRQPTTVIPNRGNAGLWLYVKDIVATCDPKTTLTVVTSNTTNQRPTQVGNVPATGTKTLSTNDNDVKQNKYPYTLSHIETQVIENQSKLQLPRASNDPTTSCFIAQTAAPLSRMIVRFQMERLNASPSLPELSLSGMTLLDTVCNPGDPLLLPSGVDRIYSIKGQYIFGYDKTAQVGTTPFVMPAAITDSKGIGDNNYIGPSSFVGGLIG